MDLAGCTAHRAIGCSWDPARGYWGSSAETQGAGSALAAYRLALCWAEPPATGHQLHICCPFSPFLARSEAKKNHQEHRKCFIASTIRSSLRFSRAVNVRRHPEPIPSSTCRLRPSLGKPDLFQRASMLVTGLAKGWFSSISSLRGHEDQLCWVGRELKVCTGLCIHLLWLRGAAAAAQLMGSPTSASNAVQMSEQHPVWWLYFTINIFVLWQKRMITIVTLFSFFSSPPLLVETLIIILIGRNKF